MVLPLYSSRKPVCGLRAQFAVAVLFSMTLVSTVSCGEADEEATQPPFFSNVTREAGINFRHHNGMEDGHKQIPEDEGAGAAWIDYDGDGDLDLYLINSNRLPGLEPNPEWRSALYRNNGDGTFTDVTEGTPLGIVGYGQGAAVGDYDNDGDPDLYVTFIGPNKLFRNEGGGKWTDVSEQAGVDDSAWGSSCAFFDYDLDGDLDLFLVRYIKWDISDMKVATRVVDGKELKLYVRPASYPPTSDVLYRNNGDGTFTDVSQEAGITTEGNGFVGLVFDFDHDGYPDVYVANDMMENFLYHNLGDGTFEEVGLITGSGYDSSGMTQNGMGGGLGDCNNDGWLDIIVSNHQAEPSALYRNERGEYFEYISDSAEIAADTFQVLSWGTCFLDYDNDGHQDFFAGNGHVETAEEALPPGETTFQPDVVFRNLGDCRFENVSNRLGPYFSEKHWSRAVVIGDYDNDGDQDVLVTVNNAEPILLRNDRGNANSWIQFRLVGEKDNREGIGARVEITANGQTQYREVRRVDGYCSSHDVRAHFGLGDAEEVNSLSVLWPDGSRQEFGQLDARRLYVIHQSKGILPPASPATP